MCTILLGSSRRGFHTDEWKVAEIHWEISTAIKSERFKHEEGAVEGGAKQGAQWSY